MSDTENNTAPTTEVNEETTTTVVAEIEQQDQPQKQQPEEAAAKTEEPKPEEKAEEEQKPQQEEQQQESKPEEQQPEEKQPEEQQQQQPEESAPATSSANNDEVENVVQPEEKAAAEKEEAVAEEKKPESTTETATEEKKAEPQPEIAQKSDESLLESNAAPAEQQAPASTVAESEAPKSAITVETITEERKKEDTEVLPAASSSSSSAETASANNNNNEAKPQSAFRAGINIQSRSASVVHMGNGVYRRANYKDGLVDRWFEDVATLHDSFMRGVTKFPNNNALGKRIPGGGYEWLTYKQAHEKVTQLSSGLRHLGINDHDTVGIYSKNRVEWQIASEACSAHSIISVALYDTLGADSCSYIVNHAELKAIICSPENISKILNLIKEMPTVRFLVSMETPKEEDQKRASELGVTLYSFDDVYKMGQEHPHEFVPPKPEDVALIMYTSGTTGMPKGVPLTHANVTATIAGVVGSLFELTSNDVLISYLPLAHILQRAVESALFGFGIAIGYWQGDIAKLMDDLMELKPTIMTAVPRVLERIKAGIEAKVKETPAFRQWIFKQAYAWKKGNVEKGKKSSILDAVVFKTIQTRVGGRLRGIISGGAYLRPEVQEFMRVVFGCPVIQGYGLTETSAGGTIMEWNDTKNGTIGAPVGCAEIKLADVPEMNYLSTNNPPAGEIWIRGANVMKGYYKDEEKTREVMTEDGWFRTGDIGTLIDNRFMIVDRIKNVIKLPQGEYVALEKVESAYAACNLVDQICVHADVANPHLVCVVIPNQKNLRELAIRLNLATEADDINAICKKKEVRDAVLNELTATGKAAKLNGFEMVKSVWLDTDPFTVENDLLTPSMKLRRPNFKKKYQEAIDTMYSETANRND
eukprot:GEZU01009573.1.p1 GENE.GEZU01009573.1~~GEZU01009573.1.p1  ORF type:complete len:873 (-),score=348.59 GEZU01009573.1:206-2824(-)